MSSGIVGLLRALLGIKDIEAPYEEILSGDPPGRGKRRGYNGKRISKRRMFRAPSAWHPVLTWDPKQKKIIAEHWERD